MALAVFLSELLSWLQAGTAPACLCPNLGHPNKSWAEGGWWDTEA